MAGWRATPPRPSPHPRNMQGRLVNICRRDVTVDGVAGLGIIRGAQQRAPQSIGDLHVHPSQNCASPARRVLGCGLALGVSAGSAAADTFTFTDAPQYYTVPSGVYALSASATGGGGGDRKST